MTAVISGFRWGVVGTAPPDLGMTLVSVGGDGRHLRRRALVLPPRRAEVRGHDLMASRDLGRGALEAVPDRAAPERLRDAARLDRSCRPPARPPRAPAAYEEIWALKDVSFEVGEGEVLGVIGRNGAGKSTLLKILTRITTPTAGRAVIRGRVGSLLEVGTGFHPELTGRENVYLNGAVLGMRRREIARKFPEIVEFAGVEKFIDTPVKRYSSGMYVRLAFSVAAHLEPEILLVDEVLAVGDAEFQRRCLGRMEELSQSGRTVIFVSHQMQAVSRLCDRAILMDKGEVVLDGPSERGRRPLPPDGLGGGLAPRRGPISRRRPGDERVRLRAVRVVAGRGGGRRVDVRRPVGIEIGFTVLAAATRRCSRRSRSSTAGRRRLQRARHEPALAGAGRPGDYVSTAWIPGNLLNEGLYTVDVAVCSLRRARSSGPTRGSHRGGLVPRPRPGRGRLVEGALPGAVAGPCGRCSSGRPRGASPCRSSGSCSSTTRTCSSSGRSVTSRPSATGSTSPTTCRRTGRRRSPRARRRARPVDVRALGERGDSHAQLEGYAGTDTWVFGSTATSCTTRRGSSGSARSSRRARYADVVQRQVERPPLRRARPSQARRERLPRSAVPLGDEALQLRRHRLVDAVSARLLHGVIAFRPGFHARVVGCLGDDGLGGRPAAAASTSAFCAARLATPRASRAGRRSLARSVAARRRRSGRRARRAARPEGARRSRARRPGRRRSTGAASS